MRPPLPLAVVVVMVLAGNLPAQTVPSCQVVVGGDVPSPRTVTASDLAALPRRTARVQEHQQAPADYQGVRLEDLLAQAGMELGPALRGPALAQYILISAADGYRVVLAVAEADSDFTDREIILADRKDGAPLDSYEGPCRLLVIGEKRPARWVRQVTRIEVRRVQ